MTKETLALKYKIKNKKEQLKNGKFFLAIVMLSIGVSYTISYYEYNVLMADYNKAIETVNRVIENRHDSVVTGTISKEAKDSVIHANDGENTEQDTPQTSIEEQIEDISLQHGYTNTALLKKLAFCESSYNPTAQNAYSTATGLYQFTVGTWEQGCKETGHDDWTLEDRTDVEKATRMAIHFIAKGQISRWTASANCWDI